MKYLLNSIGAKELDKTSMNLGMPSMVLMERAAYIVAKQVSSIADKDSNSKIVAFCGRGNNGGDGIAALRILYEWGYDVSIVLLEKDFSRLSNETKLQLEIAKNSGVTIEISSISETMEMELDRYSIIIDAILGIGFRGELNKELAELIEKLNSKRALRIAIDTPTGLDIDTGRIGIISFKADYTITFGFAKVGFFLHPGKEYIGKLIIGDIGFQRVALHNIKEATITFDKSDLSMIPDRPCYSNKGDYGRILIVGSGEGMCGASYFSALAAYRTGAGLVKIFTHSNNKNVLQTLIPEAVIESYSDEEELSDKTKLKLSNLITEWADIVILGVGLGLSNMSFEISKLVINSSKRPLIVDADGIALYKRVMEDRHKREFSPLIDIEKKHILTPHLKELSILINKPIKNIKENLIELGNSYRKIEGILVIKDANTLVVGMDKIYINSSGSSALAKAGSGDVLTGIIAGIMRKSEINFNLVALSVYIHGLIGENVAKRVGVNSSLAREIADFGLINLEGDIVEDNFTLCR